ncbi:MAG: hypothetical protein IBX64_04055 [Actinobacteria bacterium]|nr:hypothetical protein [Actinomycetota bacterium]
MNALINRKVARFIKKLNDRTRTTVLDILESPIKWNLIQFYKANPFSIHTPRGLANIIGRRADLVFKEVEGLAKAGILKKISENGNLFSIYSYEPEAEIARVINTLVDIDNEQRNRMGNLRGRVKNK